MEPGSCGNKAAGKEKKSEKSRRVWTVREEEVLLQALKEALTSGWKSENGFRCGYLVFLEEAMKKVFPATDIRGNPHINSKIHVWKKTHGALMTILSKSGIGWNESDKMIDATDEAWESILKVDNTVRGMRYRPWPYYHDWCQIFGNDRATGEHAESFADAVHDVLNMDNNVGFDVEPETEKINIGLDDYAESMSAATPKGSTASGSKMCKGKKRKHTVQLEDLFIDAMNNFTNMTRETMGELTKQLGYDREMLNATKEVFDALGRISELSMDERVIVAQILVEKPKTLALFFSLPDEARISLVMQLLNGN